MNNLKNKNNDKSYKICLYIYLNKFKIYFYNMLDLFIYLN